MEKSCVKIGQIQNVWPCVVAVGWLSALALAMQRREDMTSRRSDNLDALITFQGQESRMQATRTALWTK